MSESVRLDVCDGSGEEATLAGVAYLSARRRTLTTTFAFDEAFLGAKGAWALSPDLPLGGGRTVLSGLPGALSDTAPDRWGRNLIDRRIRGEALAAGRTPPMVTDIDYLLGVSDITRQGALRYRRDGEGPFLAPGSDVPRLLDLPHLLATSDRLVADTSDDLGIVKELLAAGSASLGGARPKASVRDGERLWIAKFPHRSDEWDVMAWEATALDLADRCGIATPPHRLVDIAGRSVLLLERFDRSGEHRIPFISAMTLLGKRDGDTADYVEIAEALGAFGAQTRDQLEQMWRRMAFSVAIHNTDDHLRNHGFLRRRDGWMLSPVFDVNPNPAIEDSRVTTIGWRSTSDVEVNALGEVAPYFDVTPSRAAEIWTEVTDSVAGWRSVANANGIRREEINRFAPVLDRRLSWG